MRVPRTDRRHVEVVITVEAARQGADVQDVIRLSRKPAAQLASQRAVLRLFRESQWSAARIARAWGLDGEVVRRIVASATEMSPVGGYDDATKARLVWRHGPARAAQIVAGDDPRTQTDIAAWRRLCARAAA